MDPTAQSQTPANTTADQPATAQTPVGEIIPPKKPLRRRILLGAGFVLVVILLALFLITQVAKPPKGVQVLPSVTPTPTQSPTLSVPPDQNAQQSMQFLPGKQYYSDSVSVITTDNPHQVLSISVTRAEQPSNYIEYTAVSFFDGTSWTRDTLTGTSTKSSIVNNTIIRNWSSTIGTAKANAADVSVTLEVKGVPIVLKKQVLHDEISMLSLPDYTKFTSQGTGSIIIGDAEHPAYFIYTRAYSLNASSLEFLNTPSKLTTKSLALWDEKGTFYLLDTLTSKNATSPYENYVVAAVQDAKNSLTKSSEASFTQSTTDAGQFQSDFSGISLTFAFLTSLNKAAANDGYTWMIGPVDGTAKVIANEVETSSYVLGLFEDIHTR